MPAFNLGFMAIEINGVPLEELAGREFQWQEGWLFKI